MAEKQEASIGETVDMSEYSFDVVWGGDGAEVAEAEARAVAQLKDGLAMSEAAATYRELVLQQREEGAQQAVAAVLEHGVRTEEDLGDGTIKFREVLPRPGGEAGDVLIRHGLERLTDDGKTQVTATYVDPKAPGATVMVTSLRDERTETITGLTGKTDLKVGDTRHIPDPVTTAAGLAPSTIDPKKDGSLGDAHGDTPAPAPAQPSGSQPSSHSSSSSSSSSPAGTQPGESYTPPPDDGANERNPSSSETVTSTKTDRTWESHTQATEGGHGESAVDTTSHTDEYTNSNNTYTYVTTTTTTNKETGESETNTSTQTTDTQRQHVDDDPGGYSNTGSAPPEEHGGRDTSEVASGDSHEQMAYSGAFGTFFGTPEHAQTGNPHTVGGDYGNPTDENASAAPTNDHVGPPSTDPLIHVEPDADGGSGAISIDQHEFQTSIHGGDFADPNDPLFGDGNVPTGEGHDTSPYEHDTDDTASAFDDDDGLP